MVTGSVFFGGGGVGASAGAGQIPFNTPYFTPVYFARVYFPFAYFGGGRLHGPFKASWALPLEQYVVTKAGCPDRPARPERWA